MISFSRKLNFSREGILTIILSALVIFGLYECVLGWEQLFGIKRSSHNLYPATGTFYNPGPYCGFLTVLIPWHWET